jgi:hypothetical protein
MACFPGMLFRHFLNESEVAQIVRCIAGIIFFYVPRELYFYFKVFVF